MEKKKILYYEEEKWFADILVRDIEEKPHYKVTLVITPADFFKEINSSFHYDLFILDIMTPMLYFSEDDLKLLRGDQLRDLNGGFSVGVVFYDMIREIDKYKETPVIFYTAKSNPNKPGTEYFLKPNDSETIIKTIDKFLKISDV